MAQQQNYLDWLREDLGSMIDSLSLDDLRKHALRSRWLDQVLWFELEAQKAVKTYTRLRLITIIGGVIIPALVSFNLGGVEVSWLRVAVFFVSLVVAITAAVEGFLQYGDRWRNYRQGAEALKGEGWRFFQLAGNYRRFQSHAQAYPLFVARIEQVIQKDVQAYFSEMTPEKEAKEKSVELSEA